jgi:transposase
MAHMLARLVYRMLKFGEAYVDKGIEYYEQKYREQEIKALHRKANALGLRLSPLTA